MLGRDISLKIKNKTDNNSFERNTVIEYNVSEVVKMNGDKSFNEILNGNAGGVGFNGYFFRVVPGNNHIVTETKTSGETDVDDVFVILRTPIARWIV